MAEFRDDDEFLEQRIAPFDLNGRFMAEAAEVWAAMKDLPDLTDRSGRGTGCAVTGAKPQASTPLRGVQSALQADARGTYIAPPTTRGGSS